MTDPEERSAWNRAIGIFWRVAPWVGFIAMTELWRRSRQQVRGRLSVDAIATPRAFEEAEPRRGRIAHGPHAIPPKGWKDIAWRTYQEIGHDRLPSVAGGVTFYTLLALFPAMGVFVSLYGLIADVAAVQQQLASMASVFPAEVINIVGEQMLRLANRPSATLSVAFLVSLLLSVWSANAGMKALFDGLNVAYDEQEKRNFFNRTLLTYVFTTGALLFLVVMTAVLIAAPIAFERMGLSELAVIWAPLRWLFLVAMAAGAFCVIYRYGPCRARATWRWVSVGALLAAGFWLIGSLGFSWYLNNVAHYDVTYGSLGAVVAFMTWIWFSVMVVLLGAEINAEIEHQTAIDTTVGPEKPMGERGAAMADSVGLAFHLDISKIKERAVSDSLRQADKVRRALRR
ncbi:MAG: YihY/virulence factor BrkB family protein [Phenylobacterium sp.]|nr:YihY/virulence factor BrkB family protein [Phenylobacterium sp.]